MWLFTLFVPAFDLSFAIHNSWVSHLILFSSLTVFIQGASHQIWVIRQSGHTGALSAGMHLLFLIKDFASISFALALGMNEGWPVLLFHGASMLFQSLILGHFYWTKVSPVAAARRLACT